MANDNAAHRRFNVSSRTRYALLILYELAMAPKDETRSIREIAEAHTLSKKYISQLVIPLRKAGIIVSVPGPKGGFHLLRSPKKITLLDLVEIMDGPVHILECVENADICSFSGQCVVLNLWRRLNSRIRNAIKSVTLDELIREKSKGGAVFPALETDPPSVQRKTAKKTRARSARA